MKKLISLFVAMAKDKTTKRGIEWLLADFTYAIYIIIMLIFLVISVTINTWIGGIIVALSFMLVLGGWQWLTFQLRKILLDMLYQPSNITDENGDDNNMAMTTLINELNDILKNIKDEAY